MKHPIEQINDILPVLKYGNPLLRKKVVDVTDFNDVLVAIDEFGIVVTQRD